MIARWSAAILIAALALGLGRARAETLSEAKKVAIFFVAPTVAAVGVSTVIGNVVTLGRGERHGFGLALAGVIVGGLELGAGALCFEEASRRDEGNELRGTLIAFGVAHLVWGAVNVGLGIWAWTRPLARWRVSLAPLPIVAIDGSLAPGVGVSIGRF